MSDQPKKTTRKTAARTGTSRPGPRPVGRRAATRKKAGTRKKAATKKKTAAGKGTAAKKRAATKKKTAKRKTAAKKRAGAKKRAATKKKTAAGKGTAAEKRTATKKKTAKRKTAAKKRAGAKKRAATKKKTAAGKGTAAEKRTATKKKTAKRKTAAKKRAGAKKRAATKKKTAAGRRTAAERKATKKRVARRRTSVTGSSEPRAAARSGGAAALDGRVARAKLDRGREAEESRPEPLPWGYGEDRIAAMGIDQERLFVYWEVTDEGMEAARRRLGREPVEEGLCLRIYDTSGRIFDGTNPVAYVDIPVSRETRQWFVRVGKPGSARVAEIGIRSRSGRFARVARSKRLELPRRTPLPVAEEQWMTVVWRSDGTVVVEHRLEGGPVTAGVADDEAIEAVRPASGGEILARDPRDDIEGEERTEERISGGGASERTVRARRPPWGDSGQG